MDKTSLGKEPIHYASVMDIAAMYREDTSDPTTVTQHFIDRITKLDTEYQSYATLTSGRALAQAERLGSELAQGKDRGPLHGIPIAVKDLCSTNGIKTMGGTEVLAANIPSFDSTVVERLTNAGAILLGKLNLTEGAMGGYNPRRQVPKNPWDKSRWSGSSSSGSGVATAAGLCVASLGSDTGGSIRFPSAACGVVGIKPTYGRVSRYGVLDLAESLDHVGPMARSVEDAALILQAISGVDDKDETTVNSHSLNLANIQDYDLSGLSIGYAASYSESDINPETVTLVQSVLEVLEEAGAHVINIDFPNVDPYLPAWTTICSAEAYQAHKAFYPRQEDKYGPWFRGWLETGYRVSAEDYIQASRIRRQCNGLVARAFENIDAFVCPTLVNFPREVDDSISYGPMDDARGTMFQRFTIPFDYNGYPSVTLPCGFSNSGLPASFQVVGKPLKEELICKIANSYQSLTHWQASKPIE